MKKPLIALAAAFAAVPAAASAAPPPPAGEEARIPFVDFHSIRNFRAVGEDVVYLQDRSDNWYRAQLFGPCFGLPWALHIGVDTRGSSTFDRFSTVLVDGERCQVQSVTRSDPPPSKKHKRG